MERKEVAQAQPQYQTRQNQEEAAGAMVLYNAKIAAQQERASERPAKSASEPPAKGLRQLKRDSVQEGFPLSSTSGSETSDSEQEDEVPRQPQHPALALKSITVGRGSASSPAPPRRRASGAPRGHDSEPEEALPVRRGAPHVVMAITVDGRKKTVASRAAQRSAAASTAAPYMDSSALRQSGPQDQAAPCSNSDSGAEDVGLDSELEEVEANGPRRRRSGDVQPAQSAPQAAGRLRGGRQGTGESPTAAASAPAGAANAAILANQRVLLKRSKKKPLKKHKRWSSEEVSILAGCNSLETLQIYASEYELVNDLQEATLLEMVNDMNYRYTQDECSNDCDAKCNSQVQFMMTQSSSYLLTAVQAEDTEDEKARIRLGACWPILWAHCQWGTNALLPLHTTCSTDIVRL